MTSVRAAYVQKPLLPKHLIKQVTKPSWRNLAPSFETACWQASQFSERVAQIIETGKLPIRILPPNIIDEETMVRVHCFDGYSNSYVAPSAVMELHFHWRNLSNDANTPLEPAYYLRAGRTYVTDPIHGFEPHCTHVPITPEAMVGLCRMVYEGFIKVPAVSEELLALGYVADPRL